MDENSTGHIPFDAPPPGTFDAIFHGLDACSQDLIGPMRPHLLAIPVRDDAGVVVGGFWGCTLYRWLHVQLLFIPEPLRGRGVGSRLMLTAEAEARSRGCIGAHVTAFSFQAPPFYQKLGYTRFGQLRDYPPGHHLLYLQKRFDRPLADSVRHADAIVRQGLQRARDLARTGNDGAAKQAYLDVLHLDATNFSALNEIGALACASGHRSAARTAYSQAVQYHPDNPIGRVNLGNLLFEDGEPSAAQEHIAAALTVDPELPEAHQAMARVLAEPGDESAELHWQKGYVGHAVIRKPYRGRGDGIPLLLLVSSRGGNVPTAHWIDDRHFAISAIYVDACDQGQSMPPHALAVNAIGDADRCGTALTCAERLLAGTDVPVINLPRRVQATGRVANARRLGGVPGVIAPRITPLPRQAIAAAQDLRFPLLLRSPGFHSGQHFCRVDSRDALAAAVSTLPGAELLLIEYVDVRQPDGMVRKYRVMFIDGALYPWHLAVATGWKVHYFTAATAENAHHRQEEQRFLDDMPGVLGCRAMAALGAVGDALGLDYAGIDFALAPDGSVVVFEANATMVIGPPGAAPTLVHRQRAAAEVITAARNMLLRRATAGHGRPAPAQAQLLTPSGC